MTERPYERGTLRAWTKLSASFSSNVIVCKSARGRRRHFRVVSLVSRTHHAEPDDESHTRVFVRAVKSNVTSPRVQAHLERDVAAALADGNPGPPLRAVLGPGPVPSAYVSETYSFASIPRLFFALDAAQHLAPTSSGCSRTAGPSSSSTKSACDLPRIDLGQPAPAGVAHVTLGMGGTAASTPADASGAASVAEADADKEVKRFGSTTIRSVSRPRSRSQAEKKVDKRFGQGLLRRPGGPARRARARARGAGGATRPGATSERGARCEPRPRPGPARADTRARLAAGRAAPSWAGDRRQGAMPAPAPSRGSGFWRRDSDACRAPAPRRAARSGGSRTGFGIGRAGKTCVRVCVPR